MYAVIKSGAHQHRVEVGDVLNVERLQAEVGDKIEINDVLMVSSDAGVSVGSPLVDGAKVVATVQGQVKGPKIRIFKFKAKKRYSRRQGHRQNYTRVKIEEILTA